MTVTFPSTQHYKKDSFGIGANVMVAKTNTMDLRFMHVGGYRTFKLYGEGVSVSSIKIESNGDEFLSGRTDVTIGSDGKPAVSFIESASNSKSVELVCDTPVVLGSTAEEYVEFWFVLPPGTLSQGFTVTITDSNGNEFTKSTSNSVEIKSGVKKSMAAFEVVVSEPDVPVPEAIDLGLSVKWASFNLGASKPEGYGDYYAWGETEPYYSSLDPLTWKEGKSSGYYYPSNKWYRKEGSNWKLTKYCNVSSSGYNGYIDDKTVLELEDDAAHVSLGGSWRMPTHAEQEELRTQCSWERTSRNGVEGHKVTGPNGNSIFLPDAGRWNGTSHITDDNHYYLWSSSLAAGVHDGYGLYYYYTRLDWGSFNRYMGFTIRPVEVFPVESITINNYELSLFVSEEATLFVTVLPENATNKTISWSSSNPSVVTVTSSGKVTGINPGVATITVTSEDGELESSCTVSVTMAIPEAIDLGLSVKWASFNLGATTSQGRGNHYAWGETETKTQYDWSTYKWCMGTYNTLTKYCVDAAYGYNSFVDGKTALDDEDDAAHVHLGEQWRMPTKEEQDELRDNCSWRWTGSGYTVTGPNKNSIFLPGAGDMTYWGSDGFYWSSNLDIQHQGRAYDLCFDDEDIYWWYSEYFSAHSIRPVTK